jgi:hypothetical protein
MRNLIEGLRHGDLEDLVLPFISLDEYESNIDDSAVVVGFYVNEKGAAEDLNRFIQRSAVELLDTQISPAPDSQGYFMVFVELLNNAKLAENVENILEEVAALTKIENWKMKVRGVDDLVPFEADEVRKAVAEQPADPVREGAMEVLTQSALLDARFEAGSLVLEGARHSYTYEFLGFGDQTAMIAEHKLDERASGITLHDAAATRNMEGVLGEGWGVHRIGDLDVLHHYDTDTVLVLRQ